MAVLMVLAVTAMVAYSNLATPARGAGLKSDAATVVRQINFYNALVPLSNKILSKSGGALDLPTAYDRAASYIDFKDGVLTLTVDDLDYSVALEPARWAEVLEWVFYTGSGQWVVLSPGE